MCSFDSSPLPQCLALASESSLTIGTIDDIQKLHIQVMSRSELEIPAVHVCQGEGSKGECWVDVRHRLFKLILFSRS